MCALVLAILFAIAECVCRIHDRRRTFWTVTVFWEGLYKTHTAKNEADAREWLACYPQSARCVIGRRFHNNFSIIARRAA